MLKKIINLRYQKQLLISALLFVNLSAHAQQDSFLLQRISVVISPALLSSYNIVAGLQTGVQYRFNEKWSGVSEIAFPVQNSNSLRIESVRYLRIGAEIKRFGNNNMRRHKRYFSLQTRYAFRRWQEVSDDYYYERKILDSVVFYDKANIKTPVLSMALKLGLEFHLGRRFMIDWFSGAGARTIFTTYKKVEGARRELKPLRARGGFVISAVDYNYTVTRFHYVSGFRLGYSLGR
jgi:hypothetical protein